MGFFDKIKKLFITFSGDGIIKLFHNLKTEPKYHIKNISIII